MYLMYCVSLCIQSECVFILLLVLLTLLLLFLSIYWPLFYTLFWVFSLFFQQFRRHRCQQTQVRVGDRGRGWRWPYHIDHNKRSTMYIIPTISYHIINTPHGMCFTCGILLHAILYSKTTTTSTPSLILRSGTVFHKPPSNQTQTKQHNTVTHMSH